MYAMESVGNPLNDVTCKNNIIFQVWETLIFKIHRCYSEQPLMHKRPGYARRISCTLHIFTFCFSLRGILSVSTSKFSDSYWCSANVVMPSNRWSQHYEIRCKIDEEMCDCIRSDVLSLRPCEFRVLQNLCILHFIWNLAIVTGREKNVDWNEQLFKSR